ncbi:MarR family winged helix-turn-helix transcriptional regulator [Geomonas oryzisoli]|uniref:MarR family winged helix-turn-helix transcriptional regulator n=1 Tax=Geomonas oryzisoli TaxID=2847992 RepID=A0ABX8J710_9BACT|nr:MarR family winged helix-turn-helix transcriptional regulator [Geomonas oryzisoli]QWV94225.1 MarR family winged helix-turn-helix transcriptional regulator [Geomonas oryzisoli]
MNIPGKSANEIAELVAAQCIAGRARRLNRVITGLYDRALQPHGIKINQASILVCLLTIGDASPGEIGARLQMEKSTVSRTIDRMVNSGWIQVSGKGPGQTVRVTESGRQLMVDCHEQWQEAQQRALALLGEEGASSLKAIADRLRVNC